MYLKEVENPKITFDIRKQPSNSCLIADTNKPLHMKAKKCKISHIEQNIWNKNENV